MIFTQISRLTRIYPLIMKKLSILFLTAISFLVVQTSLQADFKDRMKERLPSILKAKDAGSVGEGIDGFLHLRDLASEAAKKLVTDENSDRKKYFVTAAKKHGSTIQEVAQMFSNAMKSRDKNGHWQKGSSGSWSEK